jgi:PPOX class probable F420-dependent enzyme
MAAHQHASDERRKPMSTQIHAISSHVRTTPVHQASRAWALGQRAVTAVTALLGLTMLAAGIWALVAPRSFAEIVAFPSSRHFVHDAGAFQLGIGVMLLLALRWRDALSVVLAGFVVSNTVHAYNHHADLEIGGHATDWLLLGGTSVLALIALIAHVRTLPVPTREAALPTPTLAPFVEQRTVLLTTYRRDGTPVGTPVHIAVDGDRAYFRTFDTAWKVKRMRHTPTVTVAPSTPRGTPTGPALRARVRLLDGPEAHHAAQALAHKYPLLHGWLIPLGHRLQRHQTVHYELTPCESPLVSTDTRGVAS